MIAFLFWVFAQTAVAQAVPHAQMGLRVAADTVRIGDGFEFVIRVRVLPGFTPEFPAAPDSTEGQAPIIEMRDKKIERSKSDTLDYTATYKLVAWDLGQQQLRLTDVHLLNPRGNPAFLPVHASVFVRSVLPADSAKRVPKPPRPRFPVSKFNWWPLIIALIAIALGYLGWIIWKRYRARKMAPRDPYQVALEEFGKIEAMQLPERGESERYVALMVDVMRKYFSHKVPDARMSDTSGQLLIRVRSAQLGDGSLQNVLDQGDLVKFARATVGVESAKEIGANARALVDLVEKQLAPPPEAEKEKRAA
jgi:hypothetical protein